MPKGTIRNPGTTAAAIKRLDAKSKTRTQSAAKAANEWNEYRNAGHDTKSLRSSMKGVRADKSAKRGTPTINKFRKDVKSK